jgi:hypothetical protein
MKNLYHLMIADQYLAASFTLLCYTNVVEVNLWKMEF